MNFLQEENNLLTLQEYRGLSPGLKMDYIRIAVDVAHSRSKLAVLLQQIGVCSNVMRDLREASKREEKELYDEHRELCRMKHALLNDDEGEDRMDEEEKSAYLEEMDEKLMELEGIAIEQMRETQSYIDEMRVCFHLYEECREKLAQVNH